MPYVTTVPPLGWVVADVVRPMIAESAGASITEWRASRSVDEHAVLVTGCVATPIPGWVEDMRPAVEARTTALAGATAERITGVPMDARIDGAGGLVLRMASDLGGPVVGRARTFVGFDSSRVFTCFATCVVREKSLIYNGLGCESAVAEARLEGSMAAPDPGLALRGVTWAVHHPQPAAIGGGFVVLLAGILAVVTRRKPRSSP